MIVRPVIATDFDAIAALTNTYITTTAIHFSYDPVTADELRTSWLRHAATYPFLVAERDGRFAGYAKAGPWRERAAYQWTPESGIYVEHSAQGQGVGTALYSCLADALRAKGFHSVIASVTLPNDASVRLHQRLGFVKVSHVKDAGWKFNRWHDVGFWQLMLNAGPPVSPLTPTDPLSPATPR